MSAIKTQRNHSKNKQLDKETAEYAEESRQSHTSFLQSKNVLNQSYKDCKKLPMPKISTIDDTANIKKPKNHANKDTEHTLQINTSDTA